MDEHAQHNRRVMLKRVKSIWLKGVFEESLHGAEMIDLGLAYRPSALANSDDPAWQQSAEYDVPLPLGTQITDVFKAAEGELLVMGEPGAGKTTMLLFLMSDLMRYAEQDDSVLIPVVFNLATWQGQALAEWMVEQLSNNYEVPRPISRRWIESIHLMPLLDGLDEVELSRRAACADAINDFRQQYPAIRMLVTCRSHDYRTLSKRLHLDKAIVLQPLSLAQIDSYLAKRGARFAGLRAALQTDATMRELAQSPLMLSIMTLAYYRMPESVALSLGEGDMGRQLLFDVYVERMSLYRDGDKAFAPELTKRWLAWLATTMARRSQTTFFLEHLQPAELPRGQQRSFVDKIRLQTGILLALPGVLALVIGLLLGQTTAVFPILTLTLLASFIPAFTGLFLVHSRTDWLQIETVETLDWSWAWMGLGFGVGAVAGGVVGAVAAAIGRFFSEVVSVPLWIGLTAVLGGLSQVLENALIRNEVKMRTVPGQGIERSWRNGLLVGGSGVVITAVFTTLTFFIFKLVQPELVFARLLPWLVATSLYIGVTGGLLYGGLAYLQHRQLRTILQNEQHIPVTYVRFLDYAAERNLLRKVGGGYAFVHALLLDYFAGQGQAESSYSDDKISWRETR